jgi:uncharacterized membrane protein
VVEAMIEGYFQAAAGAVALAVDAVAVLIVALASLEAVLHSLQNVLSRSPMSDIRAVWLRFAGWILLALEFSLGADVVASAIAPSWDAIGKLGAIAVIRTVLSFFLARDFKDARSLPPSTGVARTET